MKFSIFLIALTGAVSAAQASSGQTADGCTYRVINGQYLTDCSKRKASDSLNTIASANQPVTSYDAVPVRHNPNAPVSSQATASPRPSPAPVMNLTIETPSQGSMVNAAQESRREREREKALDTTYVGVQLGSTSLKHAGSSTGLGVSVGTYLDDHFGVELGYSYTGQDVNLGLSNRGAGTSDSFSTSRSDANLKSHLISGEVQGYLTDTLKRLRPYLGVGLGWKSSQLKEIVQNDFGTASSGFQGTVYPDTLSQSSLGALTSAGAKLKIGKSFHLGFSLRFFFPLLRQESRLERGPYADTFGEEGRLSKADDTLTGASQYQLMGGVQYAF